MTELTEARQRLADALEAEEASETQFSPLSPDYYEQSRQIARAAIEGLDPTRAGDRERYRTAQEVHDLADDLSNIRWAKVRRLAVGLMESESTTLPERLTAAEREFLESALEIRGGRQ